MNIEGYLREFKRRILIQGGDYKTAATYHNNIAQFLDFYRLKYESPLHITTKDLEDYILYLRNKKLSASYINSFIASAKRFYRINKQPKKCNLQYHDNPPKTPNVLTYEECMAVCNAPVYLKHKAIINLLYYGALRRSELLNLKTEHLSHNRRITILKSKYGKSRVIAIPMSLQKLLIEYLVEFNPSPYLFEGEGKEQYSAKSVENIIKNTAKLCGIEKRVYPHLLRSSRATHLLDNGASDMYVSEFLGHANVQTTRDYYCRLTLNGMQSNFDSVDEKLKLNNQLALNEH